MTGSGYLPSTLTRDDGSERLLALYPISGTVIKRHKKVKGDFNAFDPEWEQYSELLQQERMADSMRYRRQCVLLYMTQGGMCAHCGCALTEKTG